MKNISCFILAIVLASTTLALAQNKDLDIKLTAAKVVQSPEGKESLEKADRAKPGEIIQYTAVYLNQSSGGIRNLEPTLPIPTGMAYVDGTAKPTPAKASLDGKTFQPLPLKRKIKSADGTEVEQDVPASEFRALRWSIGSLPSGKSVEVNARAKIVASRAITIK